MSKIPTIYDADLIAIRNREKAQKRKDKKIAEHLKGITTVLIKKIKEEYIGEPLTLYDCTEGKFRREGVYNELIDKLAELGWKLELYREYDLRISPQTCPKKLYPNTLKSRLLSLYNSLFFGHSLAIID